MTFFAPAAGGVRVRLKVRPRARRNAIDGLAPEVDGVALAVSVTTAPEDGAANAAVVALLAREWDLPRSAFEIVLGATARRKVVMVAGDPAALAAILSRWHPPADRSTPPPPEAGRRPA
ncbi:MAG: DUF167 domain-containing protein [Rhodospirillales bacterium]|nr:MAG: DUF167 domain-containing protein [Rhodospirillales bacterium]